jgi:hypothetical protein
MGMRFGRTGRAAGVAALAMAFTGVLAGTASAATFTGKDVPTTVLIAPGATGTVYWTYQNTGASVTLPPSGTHVSFTAPGNATFAPQAAIATEYSDNGSTWDKSALSLRNCVLGNSNTTLTCEGYNSNKSDQNISWNASVYRRIALQVTVAASTPAGTTLTPGRVTATFTDPKTKTFYSIDNGTLNIATPVKTPMCLDTAGGGRANGTNVQIYKCVSGEPNQNWVIDGGNVIVGGTAGTKAAMCLDTAGSGRANGTNIQVYQCLNNHPDQLWVVKDGAIILKATQGTASPMCVDVDNTRDNGNNVILYKCGTGNTNQRFVIDNGAIQVKDTL